MNINKIMKNVIGNNGMRFLALERRKVLRISDFVSGRAGKIVFNEGQWSCKIFSKRKENVFFGYYDLKQFNSNGDKLLAHVTPYKANPNEDDAEIVWIDPVTSEFHTIAKSRAWSWQQGSRLRWHPLLSDTCLYNDLEDSEYVLKQIDLSSGISKIVCSATYDIDDKFQYGIKVNFERLQRLRPGYGYSRIGDYTKNDTRPAKDGIIRIDLSTGHEQLLFSLKELSENLPDDSKYHYINHVCFSPSGNKFMFFHIWTQGASFPWNMRFYVCNTDGSNLIMLEDDVRISHYHWIDDDRIVATRNIKGKEYSYVIYNICTMNNIVLKNDCLMVDGHPNLFRHGFVTDTYPQSNRMQYLYLSDFEGRKCENIASIYSNPTNYGEHRCDLHPRSFKDKYLTVDSAVKGNVRSVLLFESMEN